MKNGFYIAIFENGNVREYETLKEAKESIKELNIKLKESGLEPVNPTIKYIKHA